MSHKNRTAARTDANQSGIIEDLRIIGLSVESSHDDILVGCMGKTYWYEIKTEENVSKKTGKVRESAKKESQKILERDWKGHYKIVSSTEEILKDIFANKG